MNSGTDSGPEAARHSALVLIPERDSSRDDPPGLADDAKRVIETLGQRAILLRADPDVVDILVSLAAADCRARNVLRERGINAATLGG